MSVSGPADSQAGFCANFTATVNGSGNYDRSVTWYVENVAGGNSSTGTISNSGNYCSPAQPPANNPVSIKAVANGDNSKSGTTSTRIIAIQISPTQVQLYVGDTQQFTAASQGAVNTSIVWKVNTAVGGNSTVGSISPTGFYTAPAQVTNQAISVAAVSADSNSIFATANVSVSGRIQISPQNPQVPYQGTQQFSATIIGSNDTSVTWRARYGTISPSGRYTASYAESPDTVTATSNHANGSTSVLIAGLQPTISDISPQPATALQQITVSGQNLIPPVTAIFVDSIGRQIPVVGANADGSSFTVTVPQGVVTGPFFAQTQSGGLPPVQSNQLQFHRLARLRIRTPQRDLSAGESVALQYALLGDATPQTITYSADVGGFSRATYTAPPVIASDSFAHITACIAGTQVCDTLMIGLHPFRIAPDVPLVPLGKTLQLSAILGGSVTGADWNMLAGGGSLTPGGLYSAGTRVQDGGPAIASATANGTTQQAQVGVTAAFPGLVNRIVDYMDQHNLDAVSTNPTGVAVIGNRMYVSAASHIGYTDSYFWIDIYDISDPLHPLWITAVEANSAGSVFSYGSYLYSVSSGDGVIPGYPNTITVYALQNGIPILKDRTSVPAWWRMDENQGIVGLIPLSPNAPPGYSEIMLFDITSGTITSRDFNVALPPDANSFFPDSAIAVGNRLFLSEIKNDISQGGYILTYDLTTSPPQFLGKVGGRSLAFYSSGNFLFGALGGMDTYDISSQLPTYLSHVDGINAWQLDGTRLLAITGQQGFRMLDMSNPQAPLLTATLFDGTINGWDLSVMVGNNVYVAQAVAGITIFDASQSGGPVHKARLFGGGFSWAELLDQHLRYPYLYGATATGAGCVLNVYDISTNPATAVSYYFDPNQDCFAVQSAGNDLYLGMTNTLQAFDLTQPVNPIPGASLPLPVISLERTGNVLFAGTSDNRLVTLDVSSPAQPRTLNTVSLPGPPIKIYASGNLLLVADNTAGLLIYDISVPASPVLLSRVTSLTAANDVIVSGTTAFVAADVDGLALIDIANPAQPTFLSRTSLSSILPFYPGQPPNQALSVALNDSLIYVGTFLDNGLVFGFDYSNRAVPRQVSVYAYGDFILTTIDTMLFHGNDLFVGGSLGYTYPLEQADMSQPLDSINQYFPPLALQNPGPPYAAQGSRYSSRNKMRTSLSPDPRFSKSAPEKIRRHLLTTR